MDASLELTLTVRGFAPDDLVDLDWSGGAEHVRAVAGLWQAVLEDEALLLVAALANGRLCGLGSVDFRPLPATGFVSMLSVHELVQGLGVGSRLLAELEYAVLERGVRRVRLHVEDDNPQAAALYRRRGYREVGSTLDSWPVAGGRTYVTVSAVLERELSGLPTRAAH